MKKLLLLPFILLVFACSTDETDDSDSTSTTPKVETPVSDSDDSSSDTSTTNDDTPETWLEMYDGQVFMASLEQVDGPGFSCGSESSKSSRRYVSFYNSEQGETFLKKGGFSCNESFEDFSGIRCFLTKEKDYDGYIIEISNNDLEGFAYDLIYENEIYYRERYEINSDGILNMYSEWVVDGYEEELIWSLSPIDDKSWSEFTEFDGIVCDDEYDEE